MAIYSAYFCRETIYLKSGNKPDDKVRRRVFSAVKVRLELEKLGAPIPVSEDRYRKLSGFSTHVSPKQNPQSAFSERNRAFIGSSVQIPGLLIVVNEIAQVLIPLGIFATRLLKPSQEVVEKLMTISKALNDSLGGIDILNLEDLGISKAPIEKA